MSPILYFTVNREKLISGCSTVLRNKDIVMVSYIVYINTKDSISQQINIWRTGSTVFAPNGKRKLMEKCSHTLK